MKTSFQYSVPSKISFGEGSSKNVGELVQQLGGKRVFCVYDKGVKATGIVSDLTNILKSSGLEVLEYDGVLPNPPDTVVYAATKIAKENNIDIIIGIGGGSSIDTAKAINILLANPAPIDLYEGPDKVVNHAKPVIAIPTTAGTSSEVTSVTVITTTKETRNMVILGKNVGADYALVDPSLTVNLPGPITAATGMDALTHSIESYVSLNSSPITEFNSLKAAELIYQNLEKAVNDGKNVEIRTNMMLGCVIVGFAFNHADLGLVHGIAHTLSAHFGLAHGVANAATLPHVMEFNSSVVPGKMKDIAAALGVNVSGLSDAEGAVAAVKTVLV